MWVEVTAATAAISVASFIAWKVGRRDQARQHEPGAIGRPHMPPHPAMNRQGYDHSQPGVDTYAQIQARLPRAKHRNQPAEANFPADGGSFTNDLAGGDGSPEEQRRALVRPSVRRSHPQPEDAL